jgi:hypothetical protein
MGYLEELEKKWNAKRKKKANRKKKDSVFNRRSGVRGPDLVHELLRLAALTNDKRFFQAAIALSEHKIIDQNFNYVTRWVPKDLAETRKNRDRLFIEAIDNAVREGLSEPQAIAAAAAGRGEAASFEAERKHLQKLYASRTEKNGAHQNSRKNGAHQNSNDSK